MGEETRWPHTAYLILGSNLGARVDSLTKARLACEEIGHVTAASSIYETEPWGVTDHPSYLNQVICLKTDLAPGKLMSACLKIEKSMGRTRRSGVSPRTIDLDILLYDNDIVEQKKVTIPHPRMHLRRFTLIPLAEIAPQVVHPGFELTIEELLERCHDRSKVNIFERATAI